MHIISKPIEEKTKSDIEKKIENLGDYVKMSYLQRALNSGLDFDTRKFVLVKLSSIYESRKMYLEAAKMVRSAAEINTTYKNKIKDCMKSVELYIKGGDYDGADSLFNQALALGDNKEKKEMKKSLKEYYLTQAKFYLSVDKRTYAKVAFEKTLSLDIDVFEKKEIQQHLLDLYNKLGLIREYYALKEIL